MSGEVFEAEHLSFTPHGTSGNTGLSCPITIGEEDNDNTRDHFCTVNVARAQLAVLRERGAGMHP